MPTMITRFTGLQKRPAEVRRRLCADRPYHSAASLLPLGTVFQPVFCIHDQMKKPSCVGQAYAAGIEPHLQRRLSAVGLWTDARRRQGDLANATIGSYSQVAIESLIRRGVHPYVEGEDERPTEQDTQIADLEDELAADSCRLSASFEHRSLSEGTRTRSACDALQRGYAVAVGDGVRAPYCDMGLDQVADADHLNDPDHNGHEQRVFAFIHPDDTRFPATHRNCFAYQNSWGRDWGGFRVPCDITCTDGTLVQAGSIMYGCALVPASVLERAWDCDALQVSSASRGAAMRDRS